MIEHDIPQMIDNFPQLAFWETDDLMPIIIAMFAGLMFNMMTPAIISGVTLSVVYIRYKRLMLPGSLHHMGYWVGLTPLNRIFTNGLAREFIQ